nr:outer dense fiber protein 3-like protein 2 [Pelodiscus sinensis]|eukprot:XP_006127073.1 outer dense fiber protein 3-like protein 2 [Pelodiscus sinensis]
MAETGRRKAPAIAAQETVYVKDSSPGPCYYVDPQLTRFGRSGGPSYSMLARSKTPAQPQTPGPGRYRPEQAPPVTQRRPPAFTLGSRTPYRRVDLGPAPNSYALPSLLGSRVPSQTSRPRVTISGRDKRRGFSEDLSQTPGPAHYNRTDPNTYLHRSPAFSMRGRHSLPGAALQTPGPGAHSPEKVTAHWARAPAHSLGVRHSDFVTPLIEDVSQ